MDGADQRVVGGIGDGHGVRELLRRVDAIAMAYGNIGIGRRRRDLSTPRMRHTTERCRGEQHSEYRDALHITAPSQGAWFGWILNRWLPRPGSGPARARRVAAAPLRETSSRGLPVAAFG